MPVVDGRNPQKIAVRDGLQTGAGHCALAKTTPRLASRSRFGVTGCGARSVRPAKAFSSSRTMTSTFGGGLAVDAGFVSAAKEVNAVSPQHRMGRKMHFFICDWGLGSLRHETALSGGI